MSRLWLKLFRDLAAYRVQAIGIAVVTTLGISMYHGFYLSYRSLGASYEWGYEELGFADSTIELDRAPQQAVRRLAVIPGVFRVAGRINRDIRVEQEPGRRQVVTGRVLSVPDEGRPEINDVVVLEGSYLGPPDRREVLLEREFAEVHGYVPGDMIYPVVDEIRNAFRVAGIVSSPEYLYAVRSRQELFPTPDSFGVMWMRRQQAERLFAMHGLINEIVCLAETGERDRVMAAMHADLRRFGATDPMPAEEQPSRKLLDLDLEVLGQFAIIFPALFIGAAALTVFSIVRRTVDRERRQIGFLRASGLPAWRIGLQYVAFGGILGLAGVIPGVLLGQWFAIGIVQVYLAILGIPFFRMASGLLVALSAIVIAVTASLLAGWRPALSAARLEPADAMRAEVSASARVRPPRWLARSLRGATFITRIAINNLFRQAYRTAYTVFGVTAGMILMITTMALMDALDYSVDYYFSEVRNYDVDVAFVQPVGEGVVEQVREWPGVEWAEGNVGLPATIHYEGRSHDYAITGIPHGSRLQVFRDADGNSVDVTGDGLFLDAAIAGEMGVERGSLTRIEYAYNSREVRVEQPVRISRAISQPLGAGLYMSADSMRRRFGARLGFPPGTITGLVIRAEPGQHETVAARAGDLPGVMMVEATDDIRAMLDDYLLMALVFIGILMLFAGTLTVAIVYNTINTNVRERRSEIATLRALGLRMREIARMITIENLASTALGMVIGLPLGLAAARLIMELFQMEAMSLEFHIYPRTYIVPLIFTLTLVLLSQVPAFRNIAGMNLSRKTRMHGE